MNEDARQILLSAGYSQTGPNEFQRLPKRPLVPILHAFVEQDWKRFHRFWFGWFPFVIVTKARAKNMHWDVADHCTVFVSKELGNSR